MKSFASSNRLEVWVRTDKEGIEKIKKGIFETILNYSDRGESRRKISLLIKYMEGQRDSIKCFGEPKNKYFGECDILCFTLNQDYLNQLSKYGHCDERFMGSGRLKMEIVN
ncbi:MAG: hypothetical protein KKB62_02295 [Nanoarchaeota archaeon]|nr:hypothetical protein [Nanoarchaeota archaeon]